MLTGGVSQTMDNANNCEKDWAYKIAKAKEALKAGRTARKGKRLMFKAPKVAP